MTVVPIRKNSAGQQQSRFLVKASAPGGLDDSCATTSTVNSDAVDVEEEITMSRPPIVICEDDALDHLGQDLVRMEPRVIYEDDIYGHPEPDQVRVEQKQGAVKFKSENLGKVKETHFHHSQLGDSIHVQRRRNKVNDDEVHEKNPHLQDFLVPHHSFHAEDAKEVSSKKECCTQGILHPEASPLEKSQVKPKRQVSFGKIMVRDYDMILGDHPCCSYGPPVTIDWNYLEYEPLDVDEYEFHHPPRRTFREMGLNYYQRKALLCIAGHSEDDIKLATKEVGRTKLNRHMTRQLSSYPVLKAESAVESARRKFKRLFKDDHWKEDKKSGLNKTQSLNALKADKRSSLKRRESV